MTVGQDPTDRQDHDPYPHVISEETVVQVTLQSTVYGPQIVRYGHATEVEEIFPTVTIL